MKSFVFALMLILSCWCLTTQAAQDERATWTKRSKINGCHLYDLTVSPSSLIGNLLPDKVSVVSPAHVNLKVCAGSCAFPMDPNKATPTPNALRRSVLRVGRPYLPEVQCVPTAYRSMSIQVYTDKMESKTIIVKDLQVRSCGCR